MCKLWQWGLTIALHVNVRDDVMGRETCLRPDIVGFCSYLVGTMS